MNFQWFFEWILVDLGRLDLRKIVLDVDKILVTDDRQ